MTREPGAPILRLMRPFQEFASRETSGGILLLACTVAALVCANTPWAAEYAAIWHTKAAAGFGKFTLSRDLHFWVNDGLMAIFFFVVGLEIKRELLVGELASPRQAALPIAGALGGVAAPALLYAALNAGGAGARGWGIPMATDIAFVMGVMALLGERVPLGLKVFLTALAIVDDIIAVLVIAVFYTDDFSMLALGAAGLCVAALIAINLLGVRHPLPFALLGMLLWLAMLASGVHAAIAGVVLAAAIPSRSALNSGEFLERGRGMLDHFEQAAENGRSVASDEQQQMAIHALEDACEKVQTPLRRFEHGLHPWVTFLIMPVFALANAGVTFSGSVTESLKQPVTLGVVLGLLCGKPLGIVAASWMSVKLRMAALPEGTGWRHIQGAGFLGGIGFTMSLFFAALAFAGEDLLVRAKVGILAGSAGAAAMGWMLLVRGSRGR